MAGTADAQPADAGSDETGLDGGSDAQDQESGLPDAGEDAEPDACTTCVCAPGQTTGCYTGAATTAGVGVCASGTSTCTPLGYWGPCLGQVLPAKEDCSAPFDEDCDGEVDEADAGCVCKPGSASGCYGGPPDTLGVGICKAGVHTCDPSGTGWGPCEDDVVPGLEDCPSLEDEDCDGKVNETGLNCVCKPGTKQACYTGPPGTLAVGNCFYGAETCAADGMSFGPCEGETLPQPEDCGQDYHDEDCDGETNEEGPSCVCVPQQYGPPCYSGPPETSGVGACSPGKLWCTPSGLGYEPECSGEVLPSKENCAAAADEDCDGKAAAACAQPLWSKTLPENFTVRVDTLGTDVWLAGSSNQPTDFGGGVLPSGLGSDSWVVRFDADGKHVWSRRFPGAGGDSVYGLAVGPTGESVLVGSCTGAAAFDTYSFDCKSPGKAYAVKLSASGAVVWAKVYGSDADLHLAQSVDVDGSGNVVLAGMHWATIDFGGGPLPVTTIASTFLAKLDPGGNHVFSKSFPHVNAGSYVGSDWLADVAALGTGDIVIAGKFVGNLDLGGGALGAAYGYKSYAGRFGALGSHVWSKAWGSSQASRLRVTPTTIFLAGQHSTTVYFGPTPISGPGQFLVELAADGTHLWSSGLPVAGWAEIRALAVRPGSQHILGGSGTAVDFGFGKGPSNAGFLVGVDYGGKVLWQYPETKVAASAAYDSLGRLYVAGSNFLWKLSP